MKIQGLKGTRDFYPELMQELGYIFKIWKETAKKYCYQEFDGPLLEPIELWTLKSGSEIPEQMYRFKDKSNSEIAVRPELTPTLARMIAAKQKELPKPIKWYSVGRFWRYEAPQSGRLREFFQFNVDCLGTDSMKADAEVIALAISTMLAFNCTKDDFYIRISNRKLTNSFLNSLGIKKLKELSRLIDKADKIEEKEFNAGLKDLGLKESQIKKLRNFLAVKSLEKLNAKDLDESGKSGLSELKQLLSYLKYYGFSEYIEIDLSIMRGFDYYTSTVFEVFDKKKEFRAIAGGGRYDDLVKDFGGESCPGIGFGMGDVVLSLFLKKLEKRPKLVQEIDYFIAPISEDVYPKAAEIATILRKKYLVSLDVSGRSLSKLMDYANSIKTRNLIIVGKKDLEKGEITLKIMDSGVEEKLKLDKLERL